MFNIVNQKGKDLKNMVKNKTTTWNVRGLRETGKQQMICKELDRLNIHILGLLETYLPN